MKLLKMFLKFSENYGFFEVLNNVIKPFLKCIYQYEK
tara:strand:- start:793 stop:903 length:111 start_codon:yes stop_codon:yes gene_type:complete